MRLLICTILLFLCSPVKAGERVSSLAILPFKNLAGADKEWLTTGISDSLVSKFAGLKDLAVLERTQIAKVLSARGVDDNEPDTVRTLLGADYLLVGSYMLADQKIRIQARILHSVTASIRGESAFVVTGDMAEIFDLQSQLASRLAETCGFEADQISLAYSHGQSLDAYRFFNLAKLAFADRQFEKAIALCLDAQKQNEGLYFAEAHTWEGRARIALAASQSDAAKRQAVIDAHVKKFEQDAAVSAPAFADLGEALQANKRFDEALEAYDSYLRWYDKSQQPVLWKATGLDRQIVTQAVTNIWQYLPYRQTSTPSPHRNRNWDVDGDTIFCIRKANPPRLCALSTKNGEVRWSAPLATGEGEVWRSLTHAGPYVFVCSPASMSCFSKDGKKIYQVSLADLHEIPDQRPPKPVLFEKSNRLVLTFFSAAKDRRLPGMLEPFDVRMLGYELSTGKKVWETKTRHYQLKDHSPRDMKALRKKCADAGLAIDLEAAAPRWVGLRMQLVGWQDRLYSIRNGVLNETDPVTGRTTVYRHMDRITASWDAIHNIWPGTERLWIELGFHAKKSLAFDPVAKGFKETRHQLYSSWWSSDREPKVARKIPVVARTGQGLTELPQKRFLPLLQQGLDAGIRTSAIEMTRRHPWLTLVQNKLLLWTSDRVLRCFDADSFQLLWKQIVPESFAGCDLFEDKLVVRIGPDLDTIQCRSTPKEGKIYRSVHVLVNKGRCYEGKGEDPAAMGLYKEALEQDAKAVEAYRALIKLYEKTGQSDKAVFYACRLQKVASPGSPADAFASKWLQEKTGLLKRLSLPYYDNGHLFTSDVVFTNRKDRFVCRLSPPAWKPEPICHGVGLQAGENSFIVRLLPFTGSKEKEVRLNQLPDIVQLRKAPFHKNQKRSRPASAVVDLSTGVATYIQNPYIWNSCQVTEKYAAFVVFRQSGKTGTVSLVVYNLESKKEQYRKVLATLPSDFCQDSCVLAVQGQTICIAKLGKVVEHKEKPKRKRYECTTVEILGLDIATGRERWRFERPLQHPRPFLGAGVPVSSFVPRLLSGKNLFWVKYCRDTALYRYEPKSGRELCRVKKVFEPHGMCYGTYLNNGIPGCIVGRYPHKNSTYLLTDDFHKNSLVDHPLHLNLATAILEGDHFVHQAIGSYGSKSFRRNADGSRVFMGGASPENEIRESFRGLRLYDMKTGQVLAEKDCFAVDQIIDVQQNGKHLVFYGDGHLYIFDWPRLKAFLLSEKK